MKLEDARITITLTATLTAILFIILSYLLPKHAVLILTIEIILLPSIYIIGNYYAERLMKEEYLKTINFISDRANNLQEKYTKEKFHSIRLEEQLKYLNKNDR